MSGDYTCAVCHGVFAKGRSDDEANAEAKDLWGVENASDNSDMGIVCDECFKAMMGESA